MSKRFNKFFCVFVVAFIFFIFSSTLLFAQGKRAGADIRVTVMELQKLIRQKQAQGIDTSKARELDRQSQEAMQRGEPDECLKLLKEAIALLEKDKDKPVRRPRVLNPQKCEDSPFGIYAAFASNEFGYFKNQMGFSNEQYWMWAENHFKNLGAHWTRSNLQLIWDIVEPVRGRGYNWNNPHLTDSIIKQIYSPGTEAHWLGVFLDGGGVIPNPEGVPLLRNPLEYPDEYKTFVREVVERYDGDGVKDASPYVKVKYWQVGNEIPNRIDSSRFRDYVQFVRMIREAALDADPEAKIALVAPTDGLNVKPFLAQVISVLADEKAFDVIDVHHWGTAQNWKMKAVSQYRKILDSEGLKNVQIWSTEHGTWQGSPKGQLQTEQDQACSLFKRYIYNLANGLDKLFWNNLMEWYEFEGDPEQPSNSVGLVSDGQGPGEDPGMFNVERLAYYTYKKMTETLEGSDWDNIETIREADGIYIYKFTKQDKPIWVAWNDNEEPEIVQFMLDKDTKDVKITEAVPRYESGKEVKDYNTAFREIRHDTMESYPLQIKFELGENPVYAQEQ